MLKFLKVCNCHRLFRCSWLSMLLTCNWLQPVPCLPSGTSGMAGRRSRSISANDSLSPVTHCIAILSSSTLVRSACSSGSFSCPNLAWTSPYNCHCLLTQSTVSVLPWSVQCCGLAELNTASSCLSTCCADSELQCVQQCAICWLCQLGGYDHVQTNGNAYIFLLRVQDSMVPAGNSIVPAGNIIVPAGDIMVPSGNIIVPAGNIMVPSGNIIVPSGNSMVPVAKLTMNDKTVYNDTAAHQWNLFWF